MVITYKQKCMMCKKNYVIATRRSRDIICYECQKDRLSGEITDPAMKKLFDIPAKFYEDNGFLRSIKINYLRYKNLTEKQIEAFKKAVAKMKEDAKKKKE